MAKPKSAPLREDRFRELSDIEHVRLRLPMYFGSDKVETFNGPIFSTEPFRVGPVTFIPALLKAFSEVIDNAVDELTESKQRLKMINITVDVDEQTISVEDNGRGIPLDKRPSGKLRPEVALTTLRAGSNFDDSQRKAGQIGMNGVGVSVTNICSSYLTVTIHRDGKRYTQSFLDGTRTIKPPVIKPYNGPKNGTEVTFTLDPAVFKHDELPMTVLRNRAYEVALMNPNFTVTFNGERIRYKKGLPELLDEVTDSYFIFHEKYSDDTELEFAIVPDFHKGRDEIMLTWVNSSLLYGGGICNTQFLNAFTDRMMAHLDARAKKAKIAMHKDDVRSGLLIMSNLKLIAPEYDNQAKIRLTGPSIRKDMDALLDAQWGSFIRKNKVWVEEIFANAQARYHNKANRAAQEKHKKSSRDIDGLLEASSTDRSKCILFVTEGDSAKANIRQVRNTEYMAALPMTGKINNVYGATVAQVLAMTKVADLLSAVGLTPGLRADPYTMRYGKIVLAMDADTDGSHIVTLYTQLLYQFWPELFDPKNPRVYRLMTPNVVAYTDKQRIHFSTSADFDKVADKYTSYKKKYMKGLGTLTIADWQQVLANLDANCHVIVDDGNLKQTLHNHFGDDVAWRKAWLMGETK